MKKTLLLLVASLLPFMSVYSDPIDITRKSTINPEGPRASIPSVTADMEADIITIDVNRYLGNASVEISNENGEILLTNTVYISGHTAFTTSVSHLCGGSYTILIGLEDGNTYIGSFNIAE